MIVNATFGIYIAQIAAKELTNIVSLTSSVGGQHYMGGLQLVLIKTNRIGDTKYNS